MPSFAVHPVEGDADHDTHELEFFVRVKIVDIATGQPIDDAYAEKPVLAPAVLQGLGRHPFRVLNSRDVKFTNADTGDFTMKVKTLRTFVPDTAGEDPPTGLLATWQCVPEFFHAMEGSELSDGLGNVFVRLNGAEPRYVCLEAGGTKFARRDLIGSREGILEIPVDFDQWLNGTTIQLRLRDYMIVKADGIFDPDFGHREINVSLTGTPTANNWSMEVGGVIRNFEQELTFTTQPGAGLNPDLTLWAVRKVKECDSTVRTTAVSRPNGTTVNGIVIHYNSGYYVNEKRGTASVLCRNAFDNNPGEYMQDNQYLSDPELALQILKKLFTSGHTGYHYHIRRDGEIVFVADEGRQVYHSGKSREPDTVTAQENFKAVGAPQETTYSYYAPREALDKSHIGINLLGHHSEARYYFTARQHWYLDRLIENIQSRRPEVEWHTILGHDESRAAYKAAHPGTDQHDKADPGAALAGGMIRLRGRHGAFPT